MSSKHQWKSTMSPAASLVEGFLGRLRPAVWPECMICERSRPAEKHWRCLFRSALEAGRGRGPHAPQFVAQAEFSRGAIRIKCVDVEIQLLRGAPPKEAPVLETSQPAWQRPGHEQPRVEPPAPPPVAAPASVAAPLPQQSQAAQVEQDDEFDTAGRCLWARQSMRCGRMRGRSKAL